MAAGGWTDRWVRLRGHRVLVRTSAAVDGATPIVHVHGFAISGRSLMPTAERLVGTAQNLVPDLPGYGRSEDWDQTLGIPALATALEGVLDALGHEKVVLLGNSMGCAVALELAHSSPDRVERLVLVSPAGGVHNQPFARAITQLLRDGLRESPRMARSAVPDYLRFGPLNALSLFSELTRFPALERFLGVEVPALAVIGSRDPLMPEPRRVAELARLADGQISFVLVEGAAHAMNFSHPGELAHVVRSWLAGVAIVDDPDEPGLTRVLHLGRR
jgi:pimeloyl-ACP methyl ester carboxylesterase